MVQTLAGHRYASNRQPSKWQIRATPSWLVFMGLIPRVASSKIERNNRRHDAAQVAQDQVDDRLTVRLRGKERHAEDVAAEKQDAEHSDDPGRPVPLMGFPGVLDILGLERVDVHVQLLHPGLEVQLRLLDLC